MKCNCISEIEEKVQANITERGLYKKPVRRVTLQGVTFVVNGNRMETKTYNTMDIELDGQKKHETLSMVHSFCPFCGTKINDSTVGAVE